MPRQPRRRCSYFTTPRDDDDGVCGCPAFWKRKRNGKRKTSLSHSDSEPHNTSQDAVDIPSPYQDSSQDAASMPLPISAVRDKDTARVVNPLSTPRVIEEEGSTASYTDPHIKHTAQNQRAQLLESETAVLPSDDSGDAIAHFFERHYVSTIPAHSIVVRKKKARHPWRTRTTSGALDETLVHPNGDKDERPLQPKLRTWKQPKKKMRRRAANIASTPVSSVVGTGNNEFLERSG